MKIYGVGGFSEVGKNMTLIDLGNDAIIFDCGLFLPPIVELEEVEKVYTEKRLKAIGAIPSDDFLDNLGIRKIVRAIIPSHAHLDHIGAIPYLAYRYKADIIGTPFTLEVLKTLLKDEKINLRNKLKTVQPNSFCYVQGRNGKKYKVDFINITHSTLQTSMLALHTKEGVVLYSNDFKFDNTPILGKKPNYDKLKEIAEEGVKVLIVDSLYSGDERKTASEKVARTLLEDVLLTTDNEGKGLFVTTFSSHIARLKSIVEFGRKLNRKIVFLGRSLNKYTSAAAKVNLCPFRKDIEISTFRNQLQKQLKKINQNRSKYMVVCTGHQGEPGSIMDRLSKNKLPFQFRKDDHVVFSSSIIPTKATIENREKLDARLKKKGVRMFNNVHVSVLPNTEVVFNGDDGIKLKEIGKIEEKERKGLKVPAFDNDLRIKWFNANLIKHDYKGKIFNIKTKSGRSVSVTSGHSLFKLEKGKIISEIGDNIKEGDYLAIPKNFAWCKELREIDIRNYTAPRGEHYKIEGDFLSYNKRVICPLKICLNNDFAKLLGYYLAEGCAPRHLSLVIGKHEEELLNEIKKSIKGCFPSNINVVNKRNTYEITFGARILGRLFKQWFGENAKTKKIPDFVFSSSKEFKLNFLGAYINGDGCIDKGKKHFRIRIKTASKKLASDLLYLLSQIGICAKFDHIDIGKKRKIAGNKKETDETFSYVIRIQGLNSLLTLKGYLSNKFIMGIDNNLKNRKLLLQQLPPESLPIDKLDLEDIKAKKGTYLYDIKHYREKSKKKKMHISPELIIKQSSNIKGFTNQLLNGDLLFDPVVKIETSEYNGPVYDFEVPGMQNFIGGFGGIMLHNSGHAGREDLRDFINMINPEHIIPAHGEHAKTYPMVELAEELGYKNKKNVHLISDKQRLKFR